MILNDGIASKNWVTGDVLDVLQGIHSTNVNIAIYEREVASLEPLAKALVARNIQFRATGAVPAISHELHTILDDQSLDPLVKDIDDLLNAFQQITKAESFRMLLSVVSTDMCKKFHTDLNDLRMLCTYSGPGTLWLKDDNVNLSALGDRDTTESIAIDSEDIQEVSTGSVAILKGAIYPDAANGVVHRSPAVEETGDKRLILRIDTLSTQNLWQ